MVDVNSCTICCEAMFEKYGETEFGIDLNINRPACRAGCRSLEPTFTDQVICDASLVSCTVGADFAGQGFTEYVDVRQNPLQPAVVEFCVDGALEVSFSPTTSPTLPTPFPTKSPTTPVLDPADPLGNATGGLDTSSIIQYALFAVGGFALITVVVASIMKTRRTRRQSEKPARQMSKKSKQTKKDVIEYPSVYSESELESNPRLQEQEQEERRKTSSSPGRNRANSGHRSRLSRLSRMSQRSYRSQPSQFQEIYDEIEEEQQDVQPENLSPIFKRRQGHHSKRESRQSAPNPMFLQTVDLHQKKKQTDHRKGTTRLSVQSTATVQKFLDLLEDSKYQGTVTRSQLKSTDVHSVSGTLLGPSAVMQKDMRKSKKFLKFVVIADFSAEFEDELTVKKGDKVSGIGEVNKDWWFVEHSGNLGIVPTKFMTLAYGEQHPVSVNDEEEDDDDVQF